MSHLTTSEDLPSATFSPGLVDGHMLCVWPDGRITDRFGQEVAHASLSPRLAKALGLVTTDICGLPLAGLSSSADLSASLASKLQEVVRIHGSTLYKMTWKEWATPSGLRRSRLRVSGRRTSESGPTGWPTPTCNTNPQPETKRGLQNLSGAVKLSGWQTPLANDATGSTHCYSGKNPDGTPKVCLKLPGAVLLTGWVTPTSRDWKDSAGMTAQRDGKERLDQLPRQAFMTGWPTPTTSNTRSPSVDAAMNMHRQDGSKTQQRLQDFAGITGPLRLTVFGEMRTGSFVEMANGVQLNPAHSRWLMGLPHAWDESSPGWQEWQAATASAA
jgi:hypothetical protein